MMRSGNGKVPLCLYGGKCKRLVSTLSGKVCGGHTFEIDPSAMKKSDMKTPRSHHRGPDDEEQEEDGRRHQEAIDRGVATEIAREDVEAKLIPEAVVPEMKRPSYPAFSQEYRLLREMQKRGRSERNSPAENPTRTHAGTTNAESRGQRHHTVDSNEIPGRTSTMISSTNPHRLRSIVPRRRRRNRLPIEREERPNNAGHKPISQLEGEPTSQEVILSLTFSDDEIEEVKARARPDPKLTTSVARRQPKEEREGTSLSRPGLHPSILLNMGVANRVLGEDKSVLKGAKQTDSSKATKKTESASLDSTSAHAPNSRKVWVAKRRRRQSTGSCRPVHIAEILFGDEAKASSATLDTIPAPTFGPERKITGCLLQCSDSESKMSDIDSESVDYSDSDDSAYALAMARTHLERKLAREARRNVEDKESAGRDASSQSSGCLLEEGGDIETELRQSQPGAFAVQGLQSTDSLSHDSLSLGMSIYSERGQASADPETGAVVDAEVYEDVVVDGSVLVEGGVVDQKTKKRLRVMQLVILCLTLGSIALVTGSLVNFAPGKEENEKGIVGWTTVGSAIFGSVEEAQALFGSSVRLSQDSSRLLATSPGSDEGTNLNVGKVYVFDRQFDVDGVESWAFSSTVEGPGQSSDAAMSLASSESADVIAAGYPRLETGGVVEIVAETKDSVTGWEVVTQFQARSLGIDDRSWFGHSVELSKNASVLAISSPLLEVAGQVVGAVYIFEQGTNGTWFPKGDPILGQSANEFFGWSVDISGDGNIVVVGAPVANDSTGIVRVYRWNGSSWSKLGADLEGEGLFTRFGESVSLSDNGRLLAVGSQGLAIEPGQAYLYRLNALDDWDLEQTFVGQEAGEEFGGAIDLSDDGAVLAIGVPQSSYFGEAAGRVDLYRRNEQTRRWELQGSSIGSASLQNFGASVSVSSDGLFVAGGAPSTAYDESVIRAGSVLVFRKEQ